MDYAEAKKRSDEVQSDLHSCCFFDVNTLVFVSKSRCVRGSVAGAEVSVRLSLCAVHRPFLLDGLTSSSFSRHAIVKASFTMVTWLNENVKLLVTYSLSLRSLPAARREQARGKDTS